MCIVSLAVVRINSLHIRYQLRLLAIASIAQFILRYGSIVLKTATLGTQLSYSEFSISYKKTLNPVLPTPLASRRFIVCLYHTE